MCCPIDKSQPHVNNLVAVHSLQPAEDHGRRSQHGVRGGMGRIGWSANNKYEAILMMQLKSLLHASRVVARVPTPVSYCGALAAAVLAIGCAGPLPLSASNAGWTATEVADSYVFGYPLVVMDALREAQTATRPVNQLYTGTSGEPGFVSSGWLDLGPEPVVLSLPDAHGRYTLVQANDMWTNVAVSAGTRTTGSRAQTIAFVGPGWMGSLPPGVARVDSPTRYLMLRVVEPGVARGAARSHKPNATPRVAPLTAWLGKHGAVPSSAFARVSPSPAGTSTGSRMTGSAARGAWRPADDGSTVAAALARVDQMSAQAFFTRLSAALVDSPPVADTDDHALQMLKQLGIVPGQPFTLSPVSAKAFAVGIEQGRARVRSVPPNGVVAANGWRWFDDDAGSYGQDYAYRAYVATVVPGAGLTEDVLTLVADVDRDNRPLSGKNDYMMHFTRNQLPVSAGGWTLVAEPLDDDEAGGVGASFRGDAHRPGWRNRHVVLTDRDHLVRNQDGSIDITVQPTAPARPAAANWLVSPTGHFRMVMRIYGPSAVMRRSNWRPPALDRQ
ncbi:Uncharacterized conserved protein [Burkholderia sp. b14]|nr:Uncharacterized conserved protein [Burkholderia sp. b14]